MRNPTPWRNPVLRLPTQPPTPRADDKHREQLDRRAAARRAAEAINDEKEFAQLWKTLD